MRFLHCADIHLGSKMESRFPKDKADERKAEVRAAFSRAVDYAKENGISVILLSGDVFDSERPLKKDKEFFYGVVKNNPSIDFLYLRGNHDTEQSYTESLPNLKTFSAEWTSYEYDGAVISGIECSPENATGMYASLSLDKNKKNIVMLHGSTSDSDGLFKINLKKLKNRNIDYLASGHLHTFSCGKIDERGMYAYPGCLEGRGFDELGEKGFISLDVGEKTEVQFIPNSYRVINEVSIDISECADMYSAITAVKNSLKYDKKDILKIELTGEIDFDPDGIEREIEKQTSRDLYFVSVVNNAVRKYDLSAVDGDISLRGEFIRTVLGASDYDENTKQRIISAGLRALAGKEAEL